MDPAADAAALAASRGAPRRPWSCQNPCGEVLVGLAEGPIQLARNKLTTGLRPTRIARNGANASHIKAVPYLGYEVQLKEAA